jgi:ribosomal protein L37E
MNDEVEFVKCLECGAEQADMGKGVSCEECGYGPMPTLQHTTEE